MQSPLRMLRPYISDTRIGDGYRTAFVLSERASTAALYLPYELATVTVTLASLARAKAIAFRPKVVRGHILRRVRLYRRYGHRFPRQATVEVLRRLGAASAAIEATVATEPLPEVAVARELRITRAEQAIEVAQAVIAIREKIELQLTEEPLPQPRSRKPRQRHVHPDQLALAL